VRLEKELNSETLERARRLAATAGLGEIARNL